MKKLLILLFSIFLLSSPSVFANDISDSIWITTYDNGHKIVMQFQSDGTCPYIQEISPSGNEGMSYDNCKWIQNNKVLVYETNNYFAVQSGIINGESMSGYYVTNWEGASGTFISERRR